MGLSPAIRLKPEARVDWSSFGQPKTGKLIDAADQWGFNWAPGRIWEYIPSAKKVKGLELQYIGTKVELVKLMRMHKSVGKDSIPHDSIDCFLLCNIIQERWACRKKATYQPEPPTLEPCPMSLCCLKYSGWACETSVLRGGSGCKIIGEICCICPPLALQWVFITGYFRRPLVDSVSKCYGGSYSWLVSLLLQHSFWGQLLVVPILAVDLLSHCNL